ncbi:hypothetical protein HF325_002906 [Metschnikowia pulcherrima]|uniref:Uncharacterized protein n=1 Tax=Metschnikowia pulcherrima TaxID=27326 RepID=A0A8H7GT48_9ASCO|nr:hypothetical protein HF325_002906 [Metschnikowia pulcherrima]
MLLKRVFALLVTLAITFSAPVSSGDPEKENIESATSELDKAQGAFHPTYVELIGHTVYRYVPANTRPESLTQSPETQLNNIFNRLKTFLVPPCFDFETFEKDADQIEMDLKNVTDRVNELSSPQKFNPQLTHVRKVFLAMVDAIEPLRHYVFMGRSDLHLVNRMIEFNVKLHAMYDSSGEPESAIEGYEDKIVRYTVMLQFWRDQFNELGGVPIGVRLMFERQSVAAGDTINALRSKVNKGK